MSVRFEQAIQKLYTAFHAGNLNPVSCEHCAVGTILDNTNSWRHLSDKHGSLQLNYVGLVNQNFNKTFNGYSPLELLQIEAEFLKGCGYSLPLHHQGKKPKNLTDKSILFNGLSAVIALLCKLDNMDNVMDCSGILKSKVAPSKRAELIMIAD